MHANPLSRRRSCKPCTASPQGSASSSPQIPQVFGTHFTSLYNLYIILYHCHVESSLAVYLDRMMLSSKWLLKSASWLPDLLLVQDTSIQPFPQFPGPEHARTEWRAIAAAELDCLDLNSRKKLKPYIRSPNCPNPIGFMMFFSCARTWTPSSDSFCLNLFVSMCANQFSSSIRVTCETSLHVHTSTWHRKHGIPICRERQGRQED